MEYRSVIRTVIAALVGVALLVLVIVLIAKAISGITGGSSTPQKQLDITQYAGSGSSAVLLVDGPTNLDQDHRQVRITVSASQTEVEVLQGYQGTVLDSRTYANNEVAYAVFLHALQLKDFTQGNADPKQADYRGYCPAGDRYIFKFNDGTRDRFTYWTTNCSGEGTFAGNTSAIVSLFRAQIAQQDINRLTDIGRVSFTF